MNLLRKREGKKAYSLIYEEHDFFGCLEFVQNTKRKSTVVALRDSYIIAISKSEIDSLIDQNEKILANIYDSIETEEQGETETKNGNGKKVDFQSSESIEHESDDQSDEDTLEVEKVEAADEDISNIIEDNEENFEEISDEDDKSVFDSYSDEHFDSNVISVEPTQPDESMKEETEHFDNEIMDENVEETLTAELLEESIEEEIISDEKLDEESEIGEENDYSDSEQGVASFYEHEYLSKR